MVGVSLCSVCSVRHSWLGVIFFFSSCDVNVLTERKSVELGVSLAAVLSVTDEMFV